VGGRLLTRRQSRWVLSTTGIASDEKLKYSRAHDAVIRVYDEAGNVIETYEHTGDFREAS